MLILRLVAAMGLKLWSSFLHKPIGQPKLIAVLGECIKSLNIQNGWAENTGLYPSDNRDPNGTTSDNSRNSPNIEIKKEEFSE